MTKQEAINEAKKINGIAIYIIPNWDKNNANYCVLRNRREIINLKKMNENWDYSYKELN